MVLAVLESVYFGWFEFRQRWSEESAPVPSELPVKGTATMIDIGARKCIHCQMMEPILEQLGVKK